MQLGLLELTILLLGRPRFLAAVLPVSLGQWPR